MSKKQCGLNVNLSKSKQLKENKTSSIDVKIEPLESPLKNANVMRETDFVSEKYLNRVAEVKEEVAHYDNCNKTFRTAWMEPDIKIEISEIDLKEERLNKIDYGLGDKSLKPKTEDSENGSPQIFEKVFIKEEKSMKWNEEEHLQEVAEEKLHESLGYGESSRQNQSSFQEKPIYENKKKFKCDECGKMFCGKQGLYRHLLFHSGVKPFKCDICEKCFSLKGNLNTHMLTHTGERHHKCDTCNKTFMRRTHLVQHKLIHSGVKQHFCDLCDKQFIQKGDLVKHKRVHSGEKPFKCDVCERTFTEKSSLIRHRRLHTGERPFSCNLCNKSFIDKSQLNQHKVKLHKN